MFKGDSGSFHHGGPEARNIQGPKIGLDLQRMSRERVLLDNDKTLEKVAHYKPTSPATSGHIEPGTSGVSFLGSKLSKEPYVTNTKRRDMFVECPRDGRPPTFIFVTIVMAYRVPTNAVCLPMVEDRSCTTCEEVPRRARMAPNAQRGGD